MSRLDSFRSKLAASGYDGAIITSEINQFYLCGFDFTDGYLIISPDRAILLTDPRYSEAAGKSADSAFEVHIFEKDSRAQMNGFFSEMKIKTLGFEDLSLSVAALERLSDGRSKITFRGLGNIIKNMRAIKDPSEIAAICSAQKITDAAFTHILKTATPNMTERELALELEFFMRKNGASAVSFDIICVSGSAASLPHGVPRDKKIERGFLTMDFGCVYGGYMSDMTRTVSVGKASGKMKEIYSTVLTAQNAAIEAAMPDVLCRDVDFAARNTITQAGYGELFTHSTGHGVGLEIHEDPRFSYAAGDMRLAPGNVVTVEPGIYLTGEMGCRIENMIAVTEDGILNLTASDRELIEIF